MTSKKQKIFLISILILFSFLYLPYINSIPYLDGNIDFVRSWRFYTGGLKEYFENDRTVHPPFKFFLVSLFFRIFGINVFSYNSLGFILGVVGIIFIFKFIKEFLDVEIAKLATPLIAFYPLFLSTGIFSLADYILTILIIVSLYFYLKEKYFWYALTTSVGFLTKETALLIPFIVFLIEILYLWREIFKNSPFQLLKKLFFIILPLTVALIWILILRLSGKKMWSDWIFSETAEKGSFYTILYNLSTFNFLNKYAYQHWRQFFFLNFNWIYCVFDLVGLIIILTRGVNWLKIIKGLKEGNTKTKTSLIVFLFFVSYFLTVLTFQTYTIPRYALPIIPFFLILTSYSVNVIGKKFSVIKNFLIIFLFATLSISLFFSPDPLAKKIWGKEKVFGETLYALNHHLAGNDGITYNFQYFFILKKRTNFLINKQIKNECYWLFPDIRNDRVTLKILNIKNIKLDSPCSM